jgi:uncharacterized membrane protein
VALWSAAALLAVALRSWAAGPLWLDEAQSVAIARLPVSSLLAALRQDGSPPLYYLLLHAWIAGIGSGAWATRLLSGLVSTAALPLFFLVGSRLSGTGHAAAGPATAGALTVLLAAVNPWLVRYSGEVRMYGLVVLLVLLLILALEQARQRPGVGPASGVAVTAGALLLTHYWAMFALGVLSLAAAGVAGWGRAGRSAARWVLIGLAGGWLLFLPWLPSFVFQLGHTGTPWARGAVPGDLLRLVVDWSSAAVPAAAALTLPVVLLLARGAARRPVGMALSAWVVATLGVAYTASTISGAAMVSRYSAVVVAPVVLLIAVGVLSLRPVPRRVAAGGLATAWLVTSVAVVTTPRTQAGEIAAAINHRARPGDTVLYCPDQLGPAVTRLLQVPVAQATFPDAADPSRVNWVRYAERQHQRYAEEFVSQVLPEAQPQAQLWLVFAEGYRAVDPACVVLIQRLTTEFGAPAVLVPARPRVFEHASLLWWSTITPVPSYPPSTRVSRYR